MSTKTGKAATAVSEAIWWLSDKIHKRRHKNRAISEEAFRELKEKLKKEI